MMEEGKTSPVLLLSMTQSDSCLRPESRREEYQMSQTSESPLWCSDPCDLVRLCGVKDPSVSSLCTCQLGRRVAEISLKADCNTFDVALALAMEG